MKELGHISEVEVLFDLSPGLLCLSNSKGYFTRVSEAFKEALGYTKVQLLSEPFMSFIDRDSWKNTDEQIAALARNEQVSLFENCYRCSDGSHKWLSWNAFQMPDGTYFGSARDITKHRELLLQKEHKLISLIESGNEIILILSAEGLYKFVSPSVKTILNSTPEFYLGKVTFQFIHPDDLAWVGLEFEAVLNTEKPVYIAPFRFQVSSGAWVWIETMATNRLSDPAIEGIVINAKDVTKKIEDEQEKRLISEELKLSNERFRLAIEATKNVIWDWNLETQRIIRDVLYQKLSGYNCSGAGDTVAGSWADCIFPDDKDRVLKSIEHALADPEKKYWHHEYRYLKTNQTISFISDHGYIVRNADHKAIRMVGAMHDITEGREKEQQILKQNKQLTEVALINSHHLRRPVASILGLVDLLEESVFDKGNREIIDHLKSTAVELDAITKRINDSITPS